MAKWITTKQAAEQLGISMRRMQALLKSGRVPSAQKRGRDWFLKDSDLIELYFRPPGRPLNS